MKKQLAATVSLLTLFTAGMGSLQAETANQPQHPKQVIQQLATNLKGELQKAIKTGGPVAAIEVCNLQAPKIAQTVSENAQWQISRTALKLRNPDNAPDAWEKAGLQAFEKAIANGENPKTLIKKEQVTIDGKTYVRVLKAIPTGEACLNCHGENLKKPIADTLAKLYPNDQATGFKKGELRGAFSLQKPL